MKIWTIDEEAERLKSRFKKVNRAKFAREQDLPGGQAMIYQHINALRPISKEAAIVYAKGFGVKVEEISPRLALEISEAAQHLGDASSYRASSANQIDTVESDLIEKLDLMYVSIEEIRLITAFRESNDMGKDMFRTAIKNAPRDMEKLKSISRPK